MEGKVWDWMLLSLAVYGTAAAIGQIAWFLRTLRSRPDQATPAVVVLIHNQEDRIEEAVVWLAGFCETLSADLLLLDLDSTDDTPGVLERLGRRYPGIHHTRLAGERAGTWCETAIFLSRSPASVVLDWRRPVEFRVIQNSLEAICQ